MIRTSRSLLAAAVLLLTATLLHAQEPIKFARSPDISPDGKLIAFSYLGDVWVVETIGGVARPVTMHEAHDTYPVFSPDGRYIAFSSNRHGSYDVFVVATQGGKPRRLTFDSAADDVNGWSPDGKNILFTSTRSTGFPASRELYTVPFEGGRQQRVSVNEGRDGVFSPKGDQVAYVRGAGTWYRKGYRGSSNDDVWISNADGSNNRRLTTFTGQDGSPMWGADGQSVYYVSEFFGTPANIVRQDAAGKSAPVQVTFHKDEAVRKARISGPGKDGCQWLVYECGGDLWLAATRDGVPPRRIAIEVYADDKSNAEQTRTFTQGCTEYAVSPDERHVAFVVHGTLCLMPIDGSGKARRLTTTASSDHSLAWAPDGQKILFVSDRDGHDDVYALEPNDPEHPKLVEALQFKVTRLTETSDPETGLSFTPDGKRVAFLRGGHLWTMNPDGTDQKLLVKDKEVIDYEFTSDGKWLAYARMDGTFASEVYVMPAGGGEAKNVTRYATYNAGITWSKDGKKLSFISWRPDAPSLYVLSMQKPAVAGAPSTSDIDWEDIHLRVEHPARADLLEGAINPDGNKVAYSSFESDGTIDLWTASVPRGSITRVTTGNLRPHRLQWSKKHSNLVYFLDRDGQIRMARLGLGSLDALLAGPGRPSAGGDAAVLSFRLKMTVNRDEEFQEMFDQSWRALAENFYDAKFHGADWNAVRARYRPLVKHVAMKEDLYALIHLMLGELNASHLGVGGFGPRPEENTADLGLIFDETYRGPGLKIAEVLKRGPADRRGLNLRPGEFVSSIDGTRITEQTDVSKLLNGKIGEALVLQLTSNANADPRDPKAFRRVEVQATGRDAIANLMYERWVENNAKRVAELSKGKLGYIHIPSMDKEGLDRFVRALYSDNFDKEAIVLDVRYNGGGATHDKVLNYLGGREHTLFRQRYGGEGPVLRSDDRKWTKPLVLLINNRSYSDAEIFPSAFKTLALGKVVGQATGGHVIGTINVALIDGSTFRIPRIGVYNVKGENMDKVGVTPDVAVETLPDQAARGIDAQLDRAVQVLTEDVAEWKKAHPGIAQAGDGKPPVTPGAVTPAPVTPMK
ncbi:MAG TPA: S41 family peptidase [Gemmataceae bacterium]|nr:S41 family peptidase [Gemmataceae bacterium]